MILICVLNRDPADLQQDPERRVPPGGRLGRHQEGLLQPRTEVSFTLKKHNVLFQDFKLMLYLVSLRCRNQ